MAKILVGSLLVVFLIGGGIFWIRNQYFEHSLITPLSSNSNLSTSNQTTEASSSASMQSLFVPYWAVSNKKIDVGNYDRVIYFGITVNESGIDTKEQGFTKLKQFVSVAGSKQKKFLTLRILDSLIGSKVLEDKKLQETIMLQTLDIAKKYGFLGIVLDFESSSLGFESVETKITQFYNDFYFAAHDQQLLFAIALFGDTFYRARPYDVASLAKNTDEILVMAYDFHKSRGNPGPNFPFEGKKTYGYDFKSMTDDFLQKVPAQKLNIVFGMFGYDWQLDNNNQSIGNAKSLSDAEINKTFLQSCSFKNCIVTRDYESAEMKVTYTDDQGLQRIVWFEDLYSIERKKEYLTKKGITSTSIWAYSYF